MDENKKQLKSNMAAKANKLPTEIVSRFMQNLSIGDRLKCERVSPSWKRALQKWGWTDQRKLDRGIVFEGANDAEIARFWEDLDDDDCHLISLFQQTAEILMDLDLGSFKRPNIEPFVEEIAKILHLLSRLKKLDFGGFDIDDFVHHFPSNLRELKSSGGMSDATLEALSLRCPNLEEVPFQNLADQDLETVIEFIGKFPRQKKLDSSYFYLSHTKEGALASVGQLKALEELAVWECDGFDGESLEAIAEGCKNLRSLRFHTGEMTEEALFQLAKIPNLFVLRVHDKGEVFTDSVLKAIAQRGQLKKFFIDGYRIRTLENDEELSSTLTDASIVYLVERCKSLVSLEFFECPQITERSLEAVVAELQRRHGSPPRALPSSKQDPGIFSFFHPGIDKDSTHELVGANPWLKSCYN